MAIQLHRNSVQSAAGRRHVRRIIPKAIRFFWVATGVFVLLGSALAQNPEKTPKADDIPQHVRSSPAFAEVILSKTILEADLEELRIRYTEEFPRVAEMKYEIEELDISVRRLSLVPEAESSKLTLALGKLMVRKAELARELFSLKRKYNDSHPEVKRAEKKLGIFESAIKSILGNDL